MPKFKVLPFGEWLPDLPPLGNPGVVTATNVIPAATSYRPMPSLTVYSGALGARCQGAFACRDSAGNVYTFAGTATKLYVLNNSDATWTDATRTSGGAYSAPADGGWSFALFGTTVIACNGVDVPQKFTVGSSSNFSALGGSPPTAKYVTVVRDQVVLANIASYPQRVAFSDSDNAEQWATGAAYLSDTQDLLGNGGWIQGIVGGEYGTILQENSIWRMDFTGKPDIYQFTEIEKTRGCKSPGSIVNIGNQIWYLSDDGFYLFNGQGSVPVGKNKFDKFFYADTSNAVDPTYMYRVSSAIDPINSLVFWAYPTSGASGGNPNRILVYNWTAQRPSLISGIACEIITRDLSKGYTLDTLDNINSSIDALPFSLDSRAYTGGNLLLSAFDANHKLNYFTGANLAATLDTSEAQLAAPARALVTSAALAMSYGSSAMTGTPTIAMLTRDRSMDAVTTGSAVDLNAYEQAPQRVDARYHAARVTIPASAVWTHAQGVRLEYEPSGMR